MRRSIIVVLCLLVLVSGCTVIIETFGYGDLSGWVYKHTDIPGRFAPLRGADVTVSGVSSVAKTATKGNFLMLDLPRGYANVTITHSSLQYPARYRVWIEADKVNEYDFYPPEVVSGKGHYIFIGIDQYANYDFDSDFSVRDAKAMQQVFRDAGAITGTSQLLTNSSATFSEIGKAIEKASRYANRDDYLVLYFSVWADGDLRGGSRVLDHIVPFDGKTFGDKNQEVVITDQQLKTWLERFPSSNITVIIDANYSASFINGTATPQSVELLALKDSGYTVMAAARSYEKANFDKTTNHSFFTQYLVEGLTGWAANENPSNDNVITAQELHSYVYRKLDQDYGIVEDFTRQLPVLEPNGSRTVIIGK